MTTNSFQKKAIRERMKQTGEAYLEASRQLYGTSDKFPTPWSELNKALDGGLRKGSVTLLGSGSGGGATSTAISIAEGAKNKRALYVSSEIYGQEFRTLDSKQDDDSSDLIFIYIGREQFGNLVGSLKGMVSSVHDIKDESDVELIVIDSFDFLTPGLPTVQEAAAMSAQIKKMAIELNLPVLLLTHLSTQSAHEKAHFRHSSDLVQNSDVVLTSHVEGEGVNLVVRKNRFGDYGQKIALDWDKENCLMTSKKSTNNSSEIN